jgi:peptidoglycan/LPS O-acetylase OafA/YrhL
MTLLLAVLLFVGVGTPAVVHALWGMGSTWPEASAEALARSVVGDGRRRMPPPAACYGVAGALAVVALWPFVLLGRAEQPWALAVAFAVAGLFVVRGMAGYSPRWRAHFRDEPFATRDRRYYSPYCLLMGVGYLALLAGEMERL